MSGVHTKEVVEDEADLRLDRWFKIHYPSLTHGRLEKLLRKGQIRVNGGRVKASTRLAPGQSVRVPPLDMPKQAARRPITLSRKDREFIESLVVYADDHVIALNKPAGLAVQGGSKTGRHVDGLLDGLEKKKGERPRLVHRLDKDTSGILLLARTRAEATRLGKALKAKEITKIYWALVIGVPDLEQGEIALPLIKRGGAGSERARVAEPGEDGAMDALTRYQLVEIAGQKLSWLALSPVTGRTHQLRAHLAAVGHPIVGDGKYGGAEAHPGGEIPSKLHLHAHTLVVPRRSRKPLELTAPLPDHMAFTWSLFGFDPDYDDMLLEPFN